MKKPILLSVLLILLLSMACGNKQVSKELKVLVFTKTAGYRHASIADGKLAITALGKEHGFEVDIRETADVFSPDSLDAYQAVIFLSTTQDVLNSEEESAFQAYIQAGGGFVGIHAAADTEYDWPWYGKLVGGYFLSHPATQEADFKVVNSDFAATDFFTNAVWRRRDEIYNYKNLNPDVTVLLTVDESSYQGGENGNDHPMAWYHEFDGGRAFYTGLGHTPESYADPIFLRHLWGGIQYAMGLTD